MTNNVFLDKIVKAQKQQNKKIKHNLNPCQGRELNMGPLAPKADALSQLRVTIVVKQFNCFYAMGRNVNKHNQICRPHIIPQIHFFL